MKKTSSILPFLILFLLTSFAFAQNERKFQGTIATQMKTLVDNAFPYDNFKVIRPALPQLRNNVLDTIQHYINQQNQFTHILEAQQSSIDSLNRSLKEKEVQLEKAEIEKNSFSLLGMHMSKGIYSVFMWFLVLALGGGLIIYIYKFNRSNVITRESKKDLDSLKDEFDTHRKRAMEREQKLKRDLLDELNKSAR